MRVLNEFVSIDLSEDQLVPIARNMLPRLEVILIGNEVSLLFRIAEETELRFAFLK